MKKVNIFLCKCGYQFIKKQTTECYQTSDLVYCNICGEKKGDVVWHCLKKKIKEHPTGSDLCLKCMENQIKLHKNENFNNQKLLEELDNILLSNKVNIPMDILNIISQYSEYNSNDLRCLDCKTLISKDDIVSYNVINNNYEKLNKLINKIVCTKCIFYRLSNNPKSISLIIDL